MTEVVKQGVLAARSYAAIHDIDITADRLKLGEVLPRLATLDGYGNTSVRISDHWGADYLLSRIDYVGSGSVRGSRVIAKVKPGHRTMLAYWEGLGEYKELTVHGGSGYFIVSSDDEDDLLGSLDSTIYRLDAGVTNTIRLPSGRFYTFEAATWSPEPLTVSCLCEKDMNGNWQEYEVRVDPGQHKIVTPAGFVDVPYEFKTGQFN